MSARPWKRVRRAIGLLAFLMALPIAPRAFAQQPQTITVTGDRLSFVLPVEPVAGDIHIDALRAWAWEVEDTRRLYLEGDVTVSIAGQVFTSTAAAVWINRIPSAEGPINQIAAYFDSVRNPAQQAGAGAAGRDLLVTGSTLGGVHLRVALIHRERPPRNELLRRGEERLARHLARTVADPPPPLHQWPQVERPREVEDRFHPVPGERYVPERDEPRAPIVVPVHAEPTPWLASPTGVVRFTAEEIEVIPGEDENTITLIGPLAIEHTSEDEHERWRRLTLTAERGVIFTDPGPLEQIFTGQLGAASIRGIYLEGSVVARANEDDYVLRAPKIYYDFRTDRAIMLDAILRTYSRQADRIVYARAREMRQVAENQWSAERVRVSTSEFHTPHIAIGARRMTITRTESPDGRSEAHLDARHITMQAAGVPFVYLPRYVGTIGAMPLRGLEVGTRDNDGLRVLSTWNLFTLLGAEEPSGVEADLKLDGFTKRGFGVGSELRYNVPGAQPGTRSRGILDVYGVYDEGIDRTASGRNVDPDRDVRGLGLWEHHARLVNDWTFQGQASWISDETFISAWRWEDFRERREYETSAYLKHQRGNAALTLLGKYELNDFVSNDYLLASRAYQVNRAPELAYRRYADSFLGGALTWSSETRLSRVALVLHEPTPRETGVPAGAFGIGLDDPVEASLLAMGLRTRSVLRGDTRHELAMPINAGNLRLTPFVVGRFTAYDDDFDEFSPDAERLRSFGAAGITVATEFQRIDDSVESRLFDLHRMRHIVEPSATVWWSWSNAGRGHYPMYDEDIEGIGDGGALRAGVRNTWQTQRGGSGRWRSVNVLTIDTAVVLRTGDTDRLYPTPQFFDYRPEYSQFGDHLDGSMIWLASDTLAITGRGIWDLEDHHFARSSIGAELQHSPVLVTFVEYRRINVAEARLELLDAGWAYQISPKYRIRIAPQWDFREEELRAISVRVTRTFPDFELIAIFRHDRITDETTVGASLGLARF